MALVLDRMVTFGLALSPYRCAAADGGVCVERGRYQTAWVSAGLSVGAGRRGVKWWSGGGRLLAGGQGDAGGLRALRQWLIVDCTNQNGDD